MSKLGLNEMMSYLKAAFDRLQFTSEVLGKLRSVERLKEQAEE